MTPEKLQEHRQRARNLFKDQLEMVKQKQYLNSLKAQRYKDEELDMLKRAKQELVLHVQVYIHNTPLLLFTIPIFTD